MAISKNDLITIVVLIIGAWLLVGCVISNPTPTPTPAPTATPTATPAPTATPTPEMQCPANCSDGNPCTSDDCAARTDFQCEHMPLTGPQTGCSGDAGNCTEMTCLNGTCGTRPKVPCCGNAVCESGEGCGTCALDCPCGGGLSCCENHCVAPTCRNDAQCNDNNACTRDVCVSNGTCSATCQHIQKTCFNDDGCCPSGCDYMTDNDCPAQSKGQPARAKNGFTVSADALYRRGCIPTTGSEKEWLALRLTLQNNGNASIHFTPQNVTIVDMESGRTYTASNPTGTDCYLRDSDFFLVNADYAPGEERTGLIYYYPGGLTVIQAAKRVVVDMGGGERLIWLLAPE